MQRPVVTAIKESPAPAHSANGIRFCSRCYSVYRQDFSRCPGDGESLVVGASDPWIGAPIGAQYAIDGFIGEGAMGRVYRAHRSDLPDRQYAIKILLGDLAASSQMRARFQAEAEHASKLAHPNLVGVVDYGATDRNVHYIVMDLVEGPSLGAIVQRGPMATERVIKLARQLCEGLDHAHSRGMIHRDFKPDNILVVGQGDLEVARIADFGLALSTETDKRLTTTGIVCTPAYAAPEQLRGQSIDQRVDLYALGTTMYEMLSGGQLPFNGDLHASVRAKLMNDPPSILLVAPQVPPALVSIIGRLLSSEPSRRPRTARAVLRALDQAVAAPRRVMRTESTRRLRVPQSVVDANDSRTLPRSRSEAPIKPNIRKARPFRRTVAQLFACGITLGGALAFFALRGPAEPLTLPFAVEMTAQVTPVPEGTVDVTEAAPVALVSEPARVLREYAVARPATVPPAQKAAAQLPPAQKTAAQLPPPQKATKPAQRRRVVGRSVVAVVSPDNPELLGARFDDSSHRLDADGFARRYGVIGRELKRLDVELGRENTDDLWVVFHMIRVKEAMATQDAREEAAAVLAQIQEAIIDRAPARE